MFILDKDDDIVSLLLRFVLLLIIPYPQRDELIK